MAKRKSTGFVNGTGEVKKDPCRRRKSTRAKTHLLIRASGINNSFSYILPEMVACVHFIRALVLGGTIEGTVGDNLLMRFGEVVVQVPPEWLEPVGEL